MSKLIRCSGYMTFFVFMLMISAIDSVENYIPFLFVSLAALAYTGLTLWLTERR